LDILISLAEFYVKSGLFDEAENLLQTAIQQNENVVEPYCCLGRIYLDGGMEDKAVEILKKAEKIDPENKVVRELLESIGYTEKEETLIKDSLDEVLNKLLEIKGIVGVILVDEVGALISAQIGLPLGGETTGAIISSLFNKIDRTAKELMIGNLNRLFFELPGGNISVFGTQTLRLIVLSRGDLFISKVENSIEEAFKRSLEILGVD